MGPTLSIICLTCNTTLTVGNIQFVANFNIEKPYPGDVVQKPKPEAKPTLSPDNPNVVYVFGGKKTE